MVVVWEIKVIGQAIRTLCLVVELDELIPLELGKQSLILGHSSLGINRGCVCILQNKNEVLRA